MGRARGRTKVKIRSSLALAGVAAIVAAAPVRAQDHPLARDPVAPALLAGGTWNGVDLERRSNCTSAQNNGSRGTYAQFTVNTDATGNFNIAQTGITGLNCSYTGRFTTTDGLAVAGTYNCTDGKQGSFHTRSVDVKANTLTMQIDAQLTGSESCTISAILGLTRFYP